MLTGKRAQWIKFLPYKCVEQSLDTWLFPWTSPPQSQLENWKCTCNHSAWDMEIMGPWDKLAKNATGLGSSGFNWRTMSLWARWRKIEKDIQHQSLTSTHVHTCTYTHTNIHRHMYTTYTRERTIFILSDE